MRRRRPRRGAIQRLRGDDRGKPLRVRRTYPTRSRRPPPTTCPRREVQPQGNRILRFAGTSGGAQQWTRVRKKRAFCSCSMARRVRQVMPPRYSARMLTRSTARACHPATRACHPATLSKGQATRIRSQNAVVPGSTLPRQGCGSVKRKRPSRVREGRDGRRPCRTNPFFREPIRAAFQGTYPSSESTCDGSWIASCRLACVACDRICARVRAATSVA